MQWSERRERFRAILGGQRCIQPASVFDALSARIAEDLGFELGMLAGSIASLAVLGAPDLALLSLTEFAGQAYRICRAGSLPLLVDADHGFGNALNVKRTVEELETAGVAAVTIEDTDLPQAFGAGGGARLISIDEGIGKMKAARAGRQDSRLIIVGRTSAPRLTTMADAIARVQAYEAAGVDAIFLVGIRTREQLETMAGATHLPLMLGGVGAELRDLDYLSAMRVRVCLQGHQPFMAAVRAVHETLKALRDGTPPANLADIASPALMKQVSREDEYAVWIDRFLRGTEDGAPSAGRPERR